MHFLTTHKYTPQKRMYKHKHTPAIHMHTCTDTHRNAETHTQTHHTHTHTHTHTHCGTDIGQCSVWLDFISAAINSSCFSRCVFFSPLTCFLCCNATQTHTHTQTFTHTNIHTHATSTPSSAPLGRFGKGRCLRRHRAGPKIVMLVWDFAHDTQLLLF